MKLILGPKQAQFLKEVLKQRIYEEHVYLEDLLGDGGPSNMRAIKLHTIAAKHDIRRCQDLLNKVAIAYENEMQREIEKEEEEER